MNSTVANAVSYVHAHYREKLRQSDIARALFCNEQRLSLDFRSAMRMSIPQYITSLRTIEACRLLMEHPDMPLWEIAEQSGFQSMRSMLRAFRVQYDCTPSEMKRGIGITDANQ